MECKELHPDISPVYRYKPSFLEREEENLGEVLITKRGEVVELDSDGFILSRCKLSCTLPVHQNSIFKLDTYYLYEPFYKYYLVLIFGELFIIKKVMEGHLELHKVVRSVSKFNVEDSENVGYSKVYVFQTGCMSPITLDLYTSETSTTPKLIGNALLQVKSQIEGLDARLKSAQQVLNDKRMFVAKLCNEVSLTNTTSESEYLCIPLMKVVGESSQIDEIKKTCPISFGKLWLRICSDSWIIGVSVSNQLEREIGRFELFAVSNGCTVKHSTLWIVNGESEGPSLLSDFIVSLTLPANSQGYVLGILNEQFPVSSRTKLPFILSYHVNDSDGDEQCHLGCIDVCLQQALSLCYCPFEKTNDVSDLLSLMMICSNISISYQISTNDMDLNDLLVDIGFLKLNEHYYICKFNSQSPLRGILMNLNQNHNPPFLNIYFRKKQQIVWILETWSEKMTWKILTHGKMCSSTALHQEITILGKCFQEIQNKSDSLTKWIPVLLECERQTEITFHN